MICGQLVLVADAWRSAYDGPGGDVVVNLAAMLIALAHRIREATAAKKGVEVDLLAQLAQAVRGSIDIDHREARHFEEITRIIAKFTGQK